MTNATVSEPTSARAERTRAAILAAAEDLFARKGFAAARLEDVADTVQMTRAALFYYYKDKQALYDAMFEDAFGPLRDELERILAAARAMAHQAVTLQQRLQRDQVFLQIIDQQELDGSVGSRHDDASSCK